MITTDVEMAERRLRQATTSGDSQLARAVVGELLDQGVGGRALVLDVLAPAQRDIGLRWQRAEATVADEHATTAVVDAALGVVESNAGIERPGGTVLAVTCAESEWHTMPARMAAQLLREAGAHVRFLGPSMPADHLREYLTRLQPEALVLSATMATSLPGAARSIEAAHDAGVPVITGGAAFGRDAALSLALGGDAWLADIGALATTALPVRPRASQPQLAWAEYLTLQQAAPAVTAAAYERLLQRIPALSRMTATQTARTREDLKHILDFLAVSVFLGEERITRDFTQWLLVVLQARGVPVAAVKESYRALAEELSDEAALLLRELAEEVPAA